MNDRPLTILLVDDDEDYLFINDDLLSGMFSNLTIAEAYNGKEAFALLNGGLKPDLIFLDLNMPIMNGWEFLSKTQNTTDFQGYRVVILSSSDLKEDQLKSATFASVVGYRGKPLDEAYVMDILAELDKASKSA